MSLLVVAGEASGDLHGARLLRELHGLSADLECFGLGGEEMCREGFEALAHSGEISVVGFTEVLRVLPRARRLLHRLLAATAERRPAAALLIDSPGFNLRLARHLERLGVPVVYYVSPQLWAWRQGRVRQIARRVRKMLVLFSFEADFYRRHDVPVCHVGHPLVDEVPVLDHVLDEEAAEPRRVAMLPGSRDNEVRSLLPVMLRALSRVGRSRPIEVMLIEARTLPEETFERLLEDSPLQVVRVRENRFQALSRCHLALCASGTATLEVGLVGTPMMVLYRVTTLTSLIGRFLVRVPRIGLVNLVLGEEVAPELVQGQVRAGQVGDLAGELLGDVERLRRMRRALAPLRELLGESGASRRAAVEVLAVLENRR